MIAAPCHHRQARRDRRNRFWSAALVVTAYLILAAIVGGFWYALADHNAWAEGRVYGGMK